ncbi:unnamed protein product [Clonostachys rosea]|uniref:Fe2OG dioxygenase domain-containing protein n=1 Tax=Bionectria ochroleuca TaxID=29856 RepID=A0ABY6UDK7_BIOOC|nr:unnamed protein product [Clonostachys rosea]
MADSSDPSDRPVARLLFAPRPKPKPVEPVNEATEDTPSPSNQPPPEKPPLDQLKAFLESQNHLFTCGGSIPINEKPRATKPRRAPTRNRPSNPLTVDEPRTSDPITIRWDVANPGGKKGHSNNACDKITLPLAPKSKNDIQRLLDGTEPATFGRGGEDVYDEAYRKALKMETTAFCSTFDPYSLGIIDTIAQVLLPSIVDSSTHRSVRAELYKLNLYTSPSGKFKKHVDTPRSPSQFGSLVVCLPLEHEGGQLKVRHEGREITYDWSTSSVRPDHATIRWAAFYSDCEHEILEVTSGHRLTLTYNLYAVRGTGRMTGASQTLDITHLPLYQAVSTALDQDPFGGKGGTLGFWCSHAYAFNDPIETPLPDTLKGVDAAIWEVFQKLNLNPTVSAVIELEDEWRWLKDWKDNEPDKTDVAAHKVWESTVPTRLVAGKDFGIFIDQYYQDIAEDERLNEIFTSWGRYLDENTQWLTTPVSQSELQIAYAAYGNQASAETIYSHCAILVDFPAKGA